MFHTGIAPSSHRRRRERFSPRPWVLAALLGLLLGLAARPGFAQSNPNTDNWIHPYAGIDAGSIDSVDVGTGTLAVDIPLVSYPERGNLPPLVIKIHYADKNWSHI